MRKKKISKYILSTPSFFLGSTSFLISLPAPPRQHKGNGEWRLHSVNHVLFLPLLPPHICLLLQCGVLPWKSVLLKLLQNGSFLWGAVIHEQTAPAGPPIGVTSPVNKPASSWAPPNRVTGPARSLIQCRLPMRFQPPLSAPTCSRVESFTGCRLYIYSAMELSGLQEDSLLHLRLQGNLCLVPRAPSPSLTLVSAGLFFSHILIPLFCLLWSGSFFPFLNITETLPASLIG